MMLFYHMCSPNSARIRTLACKILNLGPKPDIGQGLGWVDHPELGWYHIPITHLDAVLFFRICFCCLLFLMASRTFPIF